MTPLRLLAAAALLFTGAACSGGDSGSAAPEPWSFGQEIPANSEEKDIPEQPEADLTKVEAPASDRVGPDVNAVGFAEAVSSPDIGVQPCTLLTNQEWEKVSGYPLGELQTMLLEHGEACGYVGGKADTLRLAVAFYESGGWLPLDAPKEAVEVEGVSGTWSEAFPVPDSSTLVLQTAKGDLVVEVSARGADRERAKDVALEAAPLMLAKVTA